MSNTEGVTANFKRTDKRDLFDDPRDVLEEIEDRVTAIDSKIRHHRKEADEHRAKASLSDSEIERLGRIRDGYKKLIERA